MALNAVVDSFCHNQKKCGTERVNCQSSTYAQPNVQDFIALILDTRTILLCSWQLAVVSSLLRTPLCRVHAKLHKSSILCLYPGFSSSAISCLCIFMSCVLAAAARPVCNIWNDFRACSCDRTIACYRRTTSHNV